MDAAKPAVLRNRVPIVPPNGQLRKTRDILKPGRKVTRKSVTIETDPSLIEQIVSDAMHVAIGVKIQTTRLSAFALFATLTDPKVSGCRSRSFARAEGVVP